MKLILASQSPRRRALIQLLGLPVVTTQADADEDSIITPDPVQNVIETAQLKTDVLLDEWQGQTAVLLTADTTVAHNGQMLNKPTDEAHARQMLQQLRGQTHQVHTGMVLVHLADGRTWRGATTANVTMRAYSDAEIEAYIATGDPLDKAGAYAIQHDGFKPVAKLDGCFLGVMGLSVCQLIDQLQAWQLPLNIDWQGVKEAHQGFACQSLPDELGT